MPLFEGVEDMMGWMRKERVHYSRKKTLIMYMKGRRRRVFTVQLRRKVLETEAERGGKMAGCTNFIDILKALSHFPFLAGFLPGSRGRCSQWHYQRRSISGEIRRIRIA